MAMLELVLFVLVVEATTYALERSLIRESIDYLRGKVNADPAVVPQRVRRRREPGAEQSGGRRECGAGRRASLGSRRVPARDRRVQSGRVEALGHAVDMAEQDPPA